MPTLRGKELARLLRLIAALVEETPDSALESALRERFATRSRPPAAGGKAKRSRLDESYVEKAMQQLSSIADRESAIKILEEFDLTRAELELICARYDVRAGKQDNVERLRDKVVEAVVGARLNAEAIRGRPLER